MGSTLRAVCCKMDLLKASSIDSPYLTKSPGRLMVYVFLTSWFFKKSISLRLLLHIAVTLLSGCKLQSLFIIWEISDYCDTIKNVHNVKFVFSSFFVMLFTHRNFLWSVLVYILFQSNSTIFIQERNTLGSI